MTKSHLPKSKLTGPALEPLNKKTPKNLVIFLHGYGADGSNLLSLGTEWQEALPDTLFVAPNAPHPFPESGGYKWFDVYDVDPELRRTQMHGTLPIVHQFIDDAMAHYKIESENVALVGFSQGACLTMHTMLERPKKLAAAISFSGFLLDPDYAEKKNISFTPTLVVHGQEDPVVPFIASQQAYEILKTHGEVDFHARPGLDHAIDLEGSRLAQDFLKHAFHTSSIENPESEKCGHCGEVHHDET